MNEDTKKIVDTYIESSKPHLHCPNCNEKFALFMRESLKPFSVTMTIQQDNGSPYPAKGLAAIIDAMSEMYSDIAKQLGHRTMATVLGVDVDDDNSAHIRMAFLPIKPEKKDAQDE